MSILHPTRDPQRSPSWEVGRRGWVVVVVVVVLVVVVMVMMMMMSSPTGRFPAEVHFHIKRIPANTLPKEPEELEKVWWWWWL